MLFFAKVYSMNNDVYPEMSLFPIKLRISLHKRNIAQLKGSISRLKESIGRLNRNIELIKNGPIVYRCSSPKLIARGDSYASSSSESDEDLSLGLFDD